MTLTKGKHKAKKMEDKKMLNVTIRDNTKDYGVYSIYLNGVNIENFDRLCQVWLYLEDKIMTSRKVFTIGGLNLIDNDNDVLSIDWLNAMYDRGILDKSRYFIGNDDCFDDCNENSNTKQRNKMINYANKVFNTDMFRTNITPKQFYSYCKREYAKRRNGADLDDFIDSYENWERPAVKGKTIFSDYEFDERDTFLIEYTIENVHFSMEFMFYEEDWDDKKPFSQQIGAGYTSIIEYECI